MGFWKTLHMQVAEDCRVHHDGPGASGILIGRRVTVQTRTSEGKSSFDRSASVSGVTATQVQVRYDGLSGTCDEWINRDSARIRAAELRHPTEDGERGMVWPASKLLTLWLVVSKIPPLSDFSERASCKKDLARYLAYYVRKVPCIINRVGAESPSVVASLSVRATSLAQRADERVPDNHHPAASAPSLISHVAPGDVSKLLDWENALCAAARMSPRLPHPTAGEPLNVDGINWKFEAYCLYRRIVEDIQLRSYGGNQTRNRQMTSGSGGSGARPGNKRRVRQMKVKQGGSISALSLLSA